MWSAPKARTRLARGDGPRVGAGLRPVGPQVFRPCTVGRRRFAVVGPAAIPQSRAVGRPGVPLLGCGPRDVMVRALDGRAGPLTVVAFSRLQGGAPYRGAPFTSRVQDSVLRGFTPRVSGLRSGV